MNDMRLGDLDALFTEFEKAAWYNNADRDEVAEPLLLDAPTIDAVPVCRCRDCKIGEVFSEEHQKVDCPHCEGLVDFDHYCGYGKRKDGEG